jgi:succinyl-CoA synthetase beta subunit
MNYIKNAQSLEKALGLSKEQETRLKQVIGNAYHSLPDKDFNIDEVNALVAPHIMTPSEAFYAASVIITDVIGASQQK